MDENKDEIDHQFEEAWERDGAIWQATTVKQIAHFWWLKGRVYGQGEGVKIALPNEPASYELQRATR